MRNTRTTSSAQARTHTSVTTKLTPHAVLSCPHGSTLTPFKYQKIPKTALPNTNKTNKRKTVECQLTSGMDDSETQRDRRWWCCCFFFLPLRLRFFFDDDDLLPCNAEPPSESSDWVSVLFTRTFSLSSILTSSFAMVDTSLMAPFTAFLWAELLLFFCVELRSCSDEYLLQERSSPNSNSSSASASWFKRS